MCTHAENHRRLWQLLDLVCFINDDGVMQGLHGRCVWIEGTEKNFFVSIFEYLFSNC